MTLKIGNFDSFFSAFAFRFLFFFFFLLCSSSVSSALESDSELLVLLLGRSSSDSSAALSLFWTSSFSQCTALSLLFLFLVPLPSSKQSSSCLVASTFGWDPAISFCCSFFNCNVSIREALSWESTDDSLMVRRLLRSVLLVCLSSASDSLCDRFRRFGLSCSSFCSFWFSSFSFLNAWCT